MHRLFICFLILAKQSYIAKKKRRIEALREKCTRDLARLEAGKDTSDGEWGEEEKGDNDPDDDNDEVVMYDFEEDHEVIVVKPDPDQTSSVYVSTYPELFVDTSDV